MALSINQLKYLRSLRLKKFRQKYDIFIAEGDKIVQEFLKSDQKIISIYATRQWLDSDHDLLEKNQVPNYEILEKEIKKLTTLKTPGSVLMLVKIPNSIVKKDLFNSGHHLYLDRIQDPGNMGTIIRTADWFGYSSIIKSPDSVDFFNPKVVQSSMGSVANIPLMEIAWEELSNHLDKNIRTYGTSSLGQNIVECTLSTPSITVFGNESKGVNPDILDTCDIVISIPGKAGRMAESLNVAIAVGIVCAQFTLAETYRAK